MRDLRFGRVSGSPALPGDNVLSSNFVAMPVVTTDKAGSTLAGGKHSIQLESCHLL